MKRNRTIISSHRRWSQSLKSFATANVSHRERVRREKLAGTTILLFMPFLLTQLPQAITNTNPAAIIALSIELGVCLLAFFLNQKGLVTTAGILTLTAAYAQGTFTLLHYPGNLTANDLYLLVLTIIPDVLALTFFSARSLLPIFCLNAMQIWAVLMYGPHDSAIAYQLQTAPFQLFSHIYTVQLITAAVLYIWARSTEYASARASQAEKIASLERKWKDQQRKELDKKRQLDEGIQQILQTHVAVANGDLNARAPLPQGHELWQVASTLNNLIARLQSQSHTIHELRRQPNIDTQPTNQTLHKIKPQREVVTDQYPKLVIPPKFMGGIEPKQPRRPTSEH